MKEWSYTSTLLMDRTACTKPQCLYKGDIYLFTFYKISVRKYQGEKIERDALKGNIKMDLKQVRHDVVVWKFWAEDIDFVRCLFKRDNESKYMVNFLTR
jgi:hypothetical protein